MAGLLGVLVLGLPSIAAAQTAPAPGTTAISCARPVVGVTATAADRDRFVALWAPRVNNPTFLQGFIDAPSVPASILAEGFHGLDTVSQGWLVVCLVDHLIATVGVEHQPPGAVPAPADLQRVQAALGLVIFGKDALNQLRADADQTTPVSDPSPAPAQVEMTEATRSLSTTAVPAPPDTSSLVPEAPVPQQVTDLTASSTQTLTDLLAGNPQTVPVPAGPGPQVAAGTRVGPANVGALLANGLNGTIALPRPLARLLQMVQRLLQTVANIAGNLLALPPVNVVGGATYRVCRESATVPVACTAPLPVGTPVPVGLTPDLVPDVLAQLGPQPNLFAPQDVTAGFTITRLATAPPGPLPYHVFALYDPPFTGKRIQFGFDGRPSTLADKTNGSVTIKNVFSDLVNDMNVLLKITHTRPGTVEAATVAVKTLVSQGTGMLPKEVDPLVGAVQFTPVPTNLTGNLRLRRGLGSEQTTINLTSSVPTLVEAQIARDVTSRTPKSHQETGAVIDKLPTNTTVDVIRQGARTNVRYLASGGIEQVSVSDKSVPDITKPTTYSQSAANVFGVPTDVNVTLTGGSDVLYKANGSVPKVQVSTGALTEGVLQSSILGSVEGVPMNMHLNLSTGADTTAGTYTADTALGKAQVVMYDKAADEQTLTATATSFPTDISFSATKSTGVLDYASNGPIATIDAKLTRAKGSTLSLAGDHATVLKQGTKLGAEFRLSGLEDFRVEPNGKAKFSVTLTPGGQGFKARADLDSPNVLASVDISNLPSTITVTMDPKVGAAIYDAAAVVVNSVTASFKDRATGMSGLAELNDIPKEVDLTWAATGDTPQVTYAASGKLGKLHGLYVEKPGGTSFDATIESLPEWFRVSGKDPFSFDARTLATAAAGSSSIGKMTFRYASDGTFATAPTTDDHVVLKTGTATRAELVYSGLRYVSASTANKELHVDLRNTATRTFRAYVDSPTLLVEGVLAGIPDTVKVDVVGQKASYTASVPVAQVAVDIDRRNGEKLAVDVTGIPSSVALVLDSAASKVDWAASSATGGVGVVAKFGPPTLGGTRTVDSSLALTGIPAQWKVSYGAGHPKFEGVSGPIGTIAATFTNHGTATVLAGDHLSARYAESTGDLDASLHISKLSLAEFEKLTDGFKADLKMGDGSPFAVDARVQLGTTRATVTGTLSNLPTDVHLESAGGRIAYTGNTNPSFQLSAAYGTPAGLAGTPEPPSVHGLAVRDGVDSVKANLYLTGLPRVLDFNPKSGVYKVESFAPTADLVIDAQLDNLTTTPLSLLVTQQGIPSSGVNFTFGPTITSTSADGTVNTHAGYVATKALGKLSATASFGSDEAYFETSAVPQSLAVDLSFGPKTKTVTVTLGTAITSLKALYRHTGDDSFGAGVSLGDVPKALTFVLGKEDDGKGVVTPVFTYHADKEGLDLTAFAKANLFNGDVNAKADLTVVNFGKDVTADLQDKTVTVTSSPATGSFNLVATGRLKFDLNLAFDAGPLHNTRNLNLDLEIFELNLAFTNLKSLTLRGGVTSAVEGDYGTFTLGEKSNLKLKLTDKLVIDTGFGDYTLFEVSPAINLDVGNVVGNFRLAGNHLSDWVNALPTPVPCRVEVDPPDVDFTVVTVTLRPHPHSTTAGPSFTVSGATAEGGAHLVTVNPFGAIPDRVLDIIARFASPHGGDQGLGTTCPD